MLQKQPVNINFSQGIDTKTDPWQLPVGKFLEMYNSEFNTGGRLTTRNGFDKLTQSVTSIYSLIYPAFSSSLSSGQHIDTFKDELCVIDGKSFFTYSPSLSKWAYRGRHEECGISANSVIKSTHNDVNSDCAINETTGLQLIAYEKYDGDPLNNPSGTKTVYGVQYILVDNDSGATIIPETSIGDALSTRPRCVSIGSNLFLFYLTISSTNVALKAAAVTSAGLGSITTLVTNVENTLTVDSTQYPYATYDIQVIGSTIYVGYNGASTTVKVIAINTSLSVTASISKSESAANGIGIFNDASNNIWVAYNNGSATKAFIVDSALSTTVLAPTTVDSGGTASNARNVTGVYNGTTGVIFYDQPSTPIVGQYLSVATSADFTQPDPYPTSLATVSVTVGSTTGLQPYVGATIYIATGGYYRISSISGSTTFVAQNLGYSGNAASGATISSGSKIYGVGGLIKSVVNYNTLTVGGTAGTPAQFIGSCGIASKAFVKDTFAHLIVGNASLLQPTYFLCALYSVSSSITPAHVAGKICEGLGGGFAWENGFYPTVNLLSDGTYKVALGRQSDIVTYTRNSVVFTYRPTGVDVVHIDFNPDVVSSVETGNNLHFGSGVLRMYDGLSVVEHGFHLFPESVSVVISGSGFLSAGAYNYQVVYEWVDSQGQKHRSAPSAAVSITASSGDAAVLTIPYLRVTEKQNVVVSIYRTVASGSIYYLINNIGILTINSTSSATFTYTDTAGDGSITGNNQLYTSGELENIEVPATNKINTFKNRVFAIPSETPYQYWYSKQIIPGSPVEFTDTFVQNVNSVGDPLTGIALLDDKVILFTSNAIYYQVGDGPAASGASNDFSTPTFITADCGNVDFNSVVVYPEGLIFKSDKGIYRLNRNLVAQYVGAEVAAYNAYSVVSSLLSEKTQEVRFHLSDGTLIVFNYFYGQWDVFPSLSAVSSCVYNGQHTFLNSSGEVYQQSTSGYTDNGTPVNMSFTTGWINVAGLQGFERAYFMHILGKYYSSHTLTVYLYFDYDETVAQTTVITPDSSDAVEQWRVFFNKQKCEAFKVKIAVNSDGSGQALTISGINLEIGIKRGYKTFKASQSTS